MWPLATHIATVCVLDIRPYIRVGCAKTVGQIVCRFVRQTQDHSLIDIPTTAYDAWIPQCSPTSYRRGEYSIGSDAAFCLITLNACPSFCAASLQCNFIEKSFALVEAGYGQYGQ